MATYYFDGSDGVTDSDGVWTDDANAYDNNTATTAYTSTAGTSSSNYLEVDGTNAPASGGVIVAVKARLYGQNGWSSYITLSAPSGGWDWTKVQALSVRAWSFGVGVATSYAVYDGTTSLGSGISGTDSCQFNEAEIEVFVSSGEGSFYLIQGFQ